MRVQARGALALGWVLFGLTACGGGGGGGSGAPQPTGPTYSVSATISGLSGSGLVLRNNSADTANIAGNGSATFNTQLANNSAYAVTVVTQPTNPSQTCTVNNATGTIAGAAVANITVTCVTNTYAVGGTVNGLAGSGLVLINNGGNEFGVAAQGSFAFTTQVASGEPFDVRVLTQPASPNQRCTVTNGVGTVTNSAVTNVTIDCVTQVPRYAYSIDHGVNAQTGALSVSGPSVSIYGVDAGSGQLRPRGHVKVGSQPTMGLGDPQQRFWFVLNRGDATLSAFLVDDTTGALTEVAGSPYATGGTGGGDDVGPSALAMHPSGRFVYVVNGAGTDNIAAFAINQTDGALVPVAGSPFAGGIDPYWLTINASGTHAYLTNPGSSDIVTYRIDATTGVLTEVAGSRIATGTNPGLLAIHATGRFAYVPNRGSGTVSTYSVNATTGVLSAIGAPVAAGINPSISVVLHPSGRFLFLRNAGQTDTTGSLNAYAIDATSGALRPIGTPQPIGANSARATMDPAGKFLFVANRGVPINNTNNGSLSQFRIDAASGELTPVQNVTQTQPRPSMHFVSVDPSGKYVYISASARHAHYSFELDANTGALTPVTGTGIMFGREWPLSLQSFASISKPGPATFRSKFAYVPNRTANTIAGFSIDPTTGSITAVNATVSAGNSPVSAAVHPAGRHVFVSNGAGGANGIAGHSINAATGAIGAATSTIGTHPNITSLIVSANGRNVYAINPANNLAHVFAVNATTGALGQVPGPFNGVNTMAPATAIGMAPNGRFLHYLTNDGWGRAELTANGAPASGISGGSSGLAAGKAALTINPNGRFAYVALPAAVEIWAIDQYLGGLTAIGIPVPTGTAPKSIAIDATGHFLYTANSASNDISTFAINTLEGTLTEIPPRISIANPLSIAADYSGKFLYALSGANNTMQTYAINSSTGVLTAVGSPVAAAAGATEISLSRDVE